MRVDCAWQPVSAALANAMPADDWIAALALRYSMPRGRIATDGFKRSVDDAERKLSRLVARVAKTLLPLGVTADDIRNLVETRMRERHARSNADGAPDDRKDG
jgi:hypothetical protein